MQSCSVIIFRKTQLNDLVFHCLWCIQSVISTPITPPLPSRLTHSNTNPTPFSFPSLWQTSCNTVKAYVDEVLGHYVVNVTTAAYMCSQNLCHGNGRCQRRDPTSGAYLHLDPSAWSIIPRSQRAAGTRTQGPAFTAQRKPGPSQDKATQAQLLPFKCQCFPEWTGEHCSIKWMT